MVVAIMFLFRYTHKWKDSFTELRVNINLLYQGTQTVATQERFEITVEI